MRHDTTEPNATDATRHDRTTDALIVDVAEAARLLGLTAGAVRKRLERGQLAGHKVAGRWQVVLGVPANATNATSIGHTDATGATRHDRHDTTDATDATRPAAGVSPAAISQLAAIRDEWLAPLVTTIQEQAETIGRLQAERDIAVERASVAEAAVTREQAGRRMDAAMADQLVTLLERQIEQLRADLVASGQR